MSDANLMNTYGNRTTTLVRGEGPHLFDENGRRYLDAISGISVCNLGHAHPAITTALKKQADTLMHCSNLYKIEPQIRLGEALCRIAGMDKAFISNSGAEANECAIKIARKYGNDKGITEPEVITMKHSFHGRTMATISATGNDKVKEGFQPLLPGFKHATYNSITSIEEQSTANTVAVMIEPVQGEGGIRVPSTSYLNRVRALCDEKGWLLILDEIQSGNGRTGSYFCFQKNGIRPDIVTTAKGLGNGFPIGACLASTDAANVLQPGNHGTTFGGNPLASATALAVIEELQKPETSIRVQALSALFSEKFAQLNELEHVLEVRQAGLMIGVELSKPCGELVEAAKHLGVLLNVTAGSTIRLLPPFILSDDQASEIADVVIKLVREFA